MHRYSLIAGCLLLVVTVLARDGGSQPADKGGEHANARPAIANAKASSLELEDLEGAKHRPIALQGKRAAVIIFVLHDCPISNRYAPEIQRLADEFAGERAQFYLVHVDPQLSTTDAKKHAKEYGYKLPVLVDRRHDLVRRLKATTAPEAFVIGPEHKVLYRGRIDDRYAAIGKPRSQVRRQDLRMALAAVVAGRAVEVAETKAIGCYIPELDE